MTDWDLHLKTKHDGHGRCSEMAECPNEGWVLTLSGPALADDPTRQWTQAELDAGLDEARRLHKAWREALAQLDGSYRADHDEQVAYDRLVEFIEANSLNYSRFDPRGS